MKKALIGAALVVAVGGYFWWSTRTTMPPATVTTVPTETTNPAATTSVTPADTGGATPPPPTTATGYKTGTFSGNVVSFDYGEIQVAVTISGGKITNVTVPVYPTAGGHTREVTDVSLPILKQEVIASQSANVDIVSGATQTSEAFNQSLAVALAKAS